MLGFEDALKCPNCNEPNLHHERVEVFERGEDAEKGVHVTVQAGKAIFDLDMKENPSSRRNGISIFFSCEHCDSISVYEITQHKGVTYLEQRLIPTAKARSIISPDKYPNETIESCISAAMREWQARQIT